MSFPNIKDLDPLYDTAKVKYKVCIQIQTSSSNSKVLMETVCFAFIIFHQKRYSELFQFEQFNLSTNAISSVDNTFDINFPVWYLQSGCCKPPAECGFVYENETLWNPGGGLVGSNPDCTRWSNDQEQLCYQCNSCKAGVLASLKKSWRKVSVINIVVLIILVIFYVIGCAAFRNNRRIDNDEPYGEARMTKSQPSRIQF